MEDIFNHWNRSSNESSFFLEEANSKFNLAQPSVGLTHARVSWKQVK
jgi:hypothetical protein